MSTNLTPTSGKLGSSVPIPADTETADSSSIAQFVQPIINGIKWASDVVEKLLSGGAIANSGDLDISTATGHEININAARFSPSADGGDMFLRGASIGMRVIQQAAVNGGTVSIPYYTSHVYSANSSVTATIWQITAPPPGSSSLRRWTIRFFTSQAPVITIQDSTGATVWTIKRDAANANHGVELAWDGSAWEAIELMWYHA